MYKPKLAFFSFVFFYPEWQHLTKKLLHYVTVCVDAPAVIFCLWSFFCWLNVELLWPIFSLIIKLIQLQWIGCTAFINIMFSLFIKVGNGQLMISHEKNKSMLSTNNHTRVLVLTPTDTWQAFHCQQHFNFCC